MPLREDRLVVRARRGFRHGNQEDLHFSQSAVLHAVNLLRPHRFGRAAEQKRELAPAGSLDLAHRDFHQHRVHRATRGVRDPETLLQEWAKVFVGHLV